MEFVRRILKQWKWIVLGGVALIVFTLFKLPDAKLKALVQGHFNQALSQAGMSMTTTDSAVSMFFGIRYIARGVQWKWSPDSAPIAVDELRISPSLIALLGGRLSGSLRLTQGNAVINVAGGLRGNQFQGELNLSNVDLGKWGFVKALAKFDANGMTTGSLEISGNLDAPTTITGSIQMKIEKLTMPSQTISGFQVPPSSISVVNLNIPIKNGKAECADCVVGNKSSTPPDDLVGSIKGAIDLAKYLGSSKTNLEITVRVSDKIKTAFVFLDSLLPQGSLRTDGSYAIALTGPLEFLTMAPLRP